MDPSELRRIIEDLHLTGEIRLTVELKRAWWHLSVEPQQREFRKDICGMANAHASADQPRHILLGLDEDGTSHDARVPGNEADIQALLHGGMIDPIPNVRFEPHVIDGVAMCVVVVEPPFDRPYVTKEGARHVVYIRRGTSVVTATRRDLDAMYSNGSSRRIADIELTEIEARRTPQVRARGAANARGAQSANGTIDVKNLGQQAFEVVHVDVTMHGAGGVEEQVPFREDAQLPVAVVPNSTAGIVVNVPWADIAGVLPRGTTPHARAWRQVNCTMTLTCRGVSGVEVRAIATFSFR